MLLLILFIAVLSASCHEAKSPPKPLINHHTTMKTPQLDTATLAGGCFWCIEAVFQRLEGVTSVVSGYAGGTPETANYKAVCSGTTNHTEACTIEYDASVITFAEILQVFFSAHDPTTPNRQGNDVGPQYASVIYYHSPEQENTARAYIEQLTAAKTWPGPIVTHVRQFTTFFPAEDYHQNYYNENGSQPYCSFVVRPKVEKFEKLFPDKVKKVSLSK